MVEHVSMPAQHDARRTRREWLHVLLAGLGLFVVTTIVMFVTGNPNLYPTVIMLGNFLVPVVFVVEHGPGRVVIDPPEGLFDL